MIDSNTPLGYSISYHQVVYCVLCFRQSKKFNFNCKAIRLKMKIVSGNVNRIEALNTDLW